MKIGKWFRDIVFYQGVKLYEENKVTVNHLEADYVQAEVEDGQTYDVSIVFNLADDEVEAMHCDCSEDNSKCQHMAAVLSYLIEETEMNISIGEFHNDSVNTRNISGYLEDENVEADETTQLRNQRLSKDAFRQFLTAYGFSDVFPDELDASGAFDLNLMDLFVIIELFANEEGEAQFLEMMNQILEGLDMLIGQSRITEALDYLYDMLEGYATMTFSFPEGDETEAVYRQEIKKRVDWLSMEYGEEINQIVTELVNEYPYLEDYYQLQRFNGHGQHNRAVMH